MSYLRLSLMCNLVRYIDMENKPENPSAFSCSKCGIDFIRTRAQISCGTRECYGCKRARQNAFNLAKGDKLKEEGKAAYQRRKEYYKAYWQEQRKDPFYIKKRAARRKVATEIEAGRLERQPCRLCGESKSDAHHEDYSKPLSVDWLCRRCHFANDSAILGRRNDTMLRAREAL